MKSPVVYDGSGHSLWDYEFRYRLEDEGKVPCDKRFKWKMVEELKEQMSIPGVFDEGGNWNETKYKLR